MKLSRKRRTPLRFEVIGLRTLPEIEPGAKLSNQIFEAVRKEGVTFRRGDVLVIAQKIVSKAEGRRIELASVEPSPLARTWARRIRRDARLVEVVLRESHRILRMSERALITETRHGFVCANAGVDRSNVPAGWVTCLPVDPDASARRIALQIRRLTGFALPVIITDTFGRPWRLGLANVAIGLHGMRVFEDLRGTRDAHGHRLHATVMAVADEIASAAGLAMTKNAKVPAVIVRGYPYPPGAGNARQILRAEAEDLFR
ncbi:MAG: coenzyme F420-0:L-glutamate ligase [Acidobacteria bacterium]|nr:coenzyme F420-0:L-glutamate ligase [Acidobacteriota bacterium]